jgi:hypothetical protein
MPAWAGYSDLSELMALADPDAGRVRGRAILVP